MTNQSLRPSHIYPVGTQVVALKPQSGSGGSGGQAIHPPGTVGVIVHAPDDRRHAYRIRFVDGYETLLQHDDLVPLAEYKRGAMDGRQLLITHGLFDRVIFCCVVGSRAFGLAQEESDTDRRGIYLPPASLHWSLFGVPEQLENETTQEVYWELQKFLVMALKSNPNILECLYSPLVEIATPLAQELIEMRNVFLSRLVYQTYNGYVMSQFKRIQADLRNQGKVKPKHVMHLMRLLLAGIHVLREGVVPVDVGPWRGQLLAIKQGETTWNEIEAWRKQLHKDFDRAFAETRLPERPDYERVNTFLLRARQLACENVLP